MHYQSWLIFFIALAFGTILTILLIVYTAQTGYALDANNISSAKNNFQIASGFIYFMAALSLISALIYAFSAKSLADQFYNIIDEDKKQHLHGSPLHAVNDTEKLLKSFANKEQ